MPIELLAHDLVTLIISLMNTCKTYHLYCLHFPFLLWTKIDKQYKRMNNIRHLLSCFMYVYPSHLIVKRKKCTTRIYIWNKLNFLFLFDNGHFYFGCQLKIKLLTTKKKIQHTCCYFIASVSPIIVLISFHQAKYISKTKSKTKRGTRLHSYKYI